MFPFQYWTAHHIVQKNVIAFAYSVVDDDDENAVMMQYCKLYSNTQTIIIGSSIVVRRLHLW